MEEINSISLGKSTYKSSKKKTHIPSTIQADTLFHFVSKLDYLVDSLKYGMLSPRYCVEDIKYLKIPKVKTIAYPMKCFCDINMHRLGGHLEWYGYYGLAFSKEWGMNNGVQPIQYINPDSNLRKDFTIAFSAALSSENGPDNSAQQIMKNYLLHQLMYYKSYEGKTENRNTHKMAKKCFTDECEWRFIPNVTTEGYEQVYHDKAIIHANVLPELSNSMAGNPKISLKFNYDDIKYIIIKTTFDFDVLVQSIQLLNLEKTEEQMLISKILIWDLSRGDF